MAVWSLITGVLMIVAAFKLNPTYGRGWLIFSGIVSVLFGIALLVAPLVGAVVLTWWLGAYALVFGIALLVLAFKLKAARTSAPRHASGQGPETKKGVCDAPFFDLDAGLSPCSRSAAATRSGRRRRTASGPAARRGR